VKGTLSPTLPGVDYDNCRHTEKPGCLRLAHPGRGDVILQVDHQDRAQSALPVFSVFLRKQRGTQIASANFAT